MSGSADTLIAGAILPIERLPALRIVVDRLGQLLTASLRSLSGETATVTVGSARAVRFRDFHGSLPAPLTAAVLRIEPWNGQCLAILDNGLTGAAIDLLLGGRRNRAAPAGEVLPPGQPARSWTAIERAVLERLAMDVFARDLARAFEPICPVQCLLERMETAPEALAIARPAAAAITFRAEIEIADMRGGAEFLIPLATLDSVKDRLARDVAETRPGRDPAWHAHLQAELPLTNVRLRAVIETRRVSTSDLMRWRVGSHLALSRRHDEPIDLFCGELAVLQARIAEKDGRIALHVEQRRLTEDWPVPV